MVDNSLTVSPDAKREANTSGGIGSRLVECPLCGRPSSLLHHINDKWVCTECWDKAYRIKFNLPPKSLKGANK